MAKMDVQDFCVQDLELRDLETPCLVPQSLDPAWYGSSYCAEMLESHKRIPHNSSTYCAYTGHVLT